MVAGAGILIPAIGTLLGFLLTGLAAISMSVFLIAWDLGPF